MNISILSLTFPPEPAHHILELATGLVKKGHKVTVITSIPSYPYGRIYEEFRGRLYSVECVEQVKIVRLPIIPSHSRSVLGRTVYYITNFLSTLIYQIMTLPTRVDLVVAYHPPLTTAFNAMFYKKLKGTVFVCWIHDMWPETLMEAGLKNKMVLKVIGILAGYVYRNATKIMVLSRGFKQNLIEKGVYRDRIHVVPNWANPNKIPLRQPTAEICRKAGLSGKDYHVFYVGNLGEMQALESVIRAISLLKEEKDIKMVFVGTGTRETELRGLARKMDIEDSVKFIGRVSPEDVPGYYSIANALLVHIKDTDLFRITIPHKIYEYMMAAKPIIAAVRGDAREIILTANAGMACEPENPESISSAIKSLKLMPSADQANMGINGRRYLLETSTPDAIIDRIEEILKSSV